MVEHYAGLNIKAGYLRRITSTIQERQVTRPTEGHFKESRMRIMSLVCERYLDVLLVLGRKRYPRSLKVIIWKPMISATVISDRSHDADTAMVNALIKDLDCIIIYHCLLIISPIIFFIIFFD